MRALILAGLMALGAGAASAQQASSTLPPADEDTARASGVLAAIWRPFTESAGGSPAAFEAACAGANEEMAQVDDAIPQDINDETLRAVRAPTGFVIVPASDEPRALYLFPNAALNQITSGLAAMVVVDADQAMVGLADAGGGRTLVQLGEAAGRPMMRIIRPDQAPLFYVRCASTAG